MMRSEEIERIYRRYFTAKARPDVFVTNLDDLRELWGDEAVDRGLADGTITVFDSNDDDEKSKGD